MLLLLLPLPLLARVVLLSTFSSLDSPPTECRESPSNGPFMRDASSCVECRDEKEEEEAVEEEEE